MAYVVSGLIFKIIGLKATLGLSYTISLIGMLSLILVKTENKALLSLFVLGSKFGGDFLVYLGDPVRFHAKYIVLCKGMF